MFNNGSVQSWYSSYYIFPKLRFCCVQTQAMAASILGMCAFLSANKYFSCFVVEGQSIFQPFSLAR